jgi:hypothetical protein
MIDYTAILLSILAYFMRNLVTMVMATLTLLILIFCIKYYQNSRREGFKHVMICFILQFASNAATLIIDLPNLVFTLYQVYNLTIGLVSIISGIVMLVLGAIFAISLIFLLIGLKNLFNERPAV